MQLVLYFVVVVVIMMVEIYIKIYNGGQFYCGIALMRNSMTQFGNPLDLLTITWLHWGLSVSSSFGIQIFETIPDNSNTIHIINMNINSTKPNKLWSSIYIYFLHIYLIEHDKFNISIQIWNRSLLTISPNWIYRQPSKKETSPLNFSKKGIVGCLGVLVWSLWRGEGTAYNNRKLPITGWLTFNQLWLRSVYPLQLLSVHLFVYKRDKSRYISCQKFSFVHFYAIHIPNLN